MKVKELTKTKLKQFEKLLEKEKEETLKIIRDINTSQRKGVKNENGDLSSYSTHQADQGTDADSQEKEVYMLENQQEKLKEINQALKRIFEKSYGLCEMCGDLIEEGRLKIVPFATMCINCKTSEEEKKKRKR
ncbi:MAG: TraR/DksA family transcriptional regulator [Candidatus Cloacimonetes bacterium]|nr:TraR/DksA family transcriptional regulator [Candidatus Cloacimonadota bacterium]